jgi:arylsulfate sulfotransferase
MHRVYLLWIFILITTINCNIYIFANPVRFNNLISDSTKLIDHNFPEDLPFLSSSKSNKKDAYYFFAIIPLDISQSLKYFLIVADNNGVPVFYKRLFSMPTDLKFQPNGLLTYYDSENGKFYGMDSSFSLVDSFEVKNYNTNNHELIITPNGHSLMIGEDIIPFDLSEDGGISNADIILNVIQEQDENKNIVFQWNSINYLKVRDATDDINIADYVVDYCHINSIEIDYDENLIISNRHRDEVIKIDRHSGDIIWILGGKNNQFTFINDSLGFSHQHDARRLNNGNIGLFDNGNLHWENAPSRGLEIRLDENNKTAEVVWEYKHSPKIESNQMGNLCIYDDGSKLISWGWSLYSNTKITHLDKNDSIINELDFPPGLITYRAQTYLLPESFFSTLTANPKLPLNNSVISLIGDELQFLWNKNKFAQSFLFQLSDDSTFSNLIYENNGLRDSTIKLSKSFFNFDKKYYWRVMSYNNGNDIGGRNSWTEIFSFKTSQFTSVNQKELKLNITKITPNPATDRTNLNIIVPDYDRYLISIIDELGNINETLVDTYLIKGEYRYIIESDKYSNGNYFIQLKSSKEKVTQKMIILN